MPILIFSLLTFVACVAAHPPLLYTNYASGTPNKTTSSNSTWSFPSHSPSHSLTPETDISTFQTTTLLSIVSSVTFTEVVATSSKSGSFHNSSTYDASTLTKVATPLNAFPTAYPSSGYPNTTSLNSTWNRPMNLTVTRTSLNSSRGSTVKSLLPVQSGRVSETPLNLTSVPANGTWAYSLKNDSFVPTKEPKASFRVAAARVKPKMVFAHFMVSNVAHWEVPEWEGDMELAKQARIDGFALNFAKDEAGNLESIDKAFKAASNKDFKLIFSFDYAGNGEWEKTTVTNLINKYKGYSSYHKHLSSGPLVSTFEGFGKASDWIDIKVATGCFFVPDWSSKGAKAALAPGVANGLFSWAAWPWGNTDMDTYVDASYLDYLAQSGDDKVYMMPVSPWFFTNLKFWDKNWLWRGDDLWRDRWEQVMQVQPDYVQIITWNDYGESHYIGPLHDGVYGAFTKGLAPYNYVLDMPHDGWRQLLPYWIETYKNGFSYVAREKLVVWYRLYPAASVVCADGGTTGNTATQLQAEFSPREVVQDKIFFSAILTGPSTVSVTVGGVSLAAVWTDVPYDGVGIHHGSAFFGSAAGEVVVTVQRIPTFVGRAITTGCQNGIINWNAWVGVSKGPDLTGAAIKRPSLAVAEQSCIKGTAPIGFRGMCEFTCEYGYCPIGACQCLAMGKLKVPPPSTGKIGYPIAGKSSSYIGLCNFACNLGYCPSSTCGYTLQPLIEPTVSPFLPAACNQGTSIAGKGELQGLCEYSCNVGFCPIHVCKCTRYGGLNEPVGVITGARGAPSLGVGDDAGLCMFTCSRGYCPSGTCLDDTRKAFVCYEDDDDPPECKFDKPYCDLELEFDTLDSLYAKIGDFPRTCAAIYTISTMSKLLKKSLAGYDALDKGYDKAFGYYKTWVRGLVPQALGSFLDPAGGPGNKYFTCTPLGGQPVQCPINNQASFAYDWTVRYTLKDKAGFLKELEELHGVTEGWIEFGDTEETFCFDAGSGLRGAPPTSPAPSANAPISKRCTFARTHTSLGIAKPASNLDALIPDPKKTISDSMPKMEQLQRSLDATMMDMMAGQWTESNDDALQVLSMPVFLMIQAIDSMKQVKDIGEDLAEKQKQTFIMLIITAIFFLLPFAGPALAANGAVMAGRIVSMLVVAGDVALGMKEIVENKDAAAFVILGLLLGGVGWKVPSNLGTMAKSRKAIKPGDIVKMGTTFKAHDDILQKIVKSCTR